jgi:hypothetical protein
MAEITVNVRNCPEVTPSQKPVSPNTLLKRKANRLVEPTLSRKEIK